MKPTYDHPLDVLRFCAAHPDAALVVVTAVTGGTLRARGALMAVTEDEVAGYVSNGCVDADIVARARSDHSGELVYGEGSPFRDIALPCGGRIEVALVQTLDPNDVSAALLSLEARQETRLVLGDLSVNMAPRLQVRIAGRGTACVALAELVEASGYEVFLQSPDADLAIDVDHLRDPLRPLPVTDDAWTAVVVLFHDHDWEPAILKQALCGSAFYVGAMGSEKTHDLRKQTLLSMDVTQMQIARIHAPIGLIPAQRNARSLALSILAEIVQVAQAESLI